MDKKRSIVITGASLTEKASSKVADKPEALVTLTSKGS